VRALTSENKKALLGLLHSGWGWTR